MFDLLAADCKTKYTTTAKKKKKTTFFCAHNTNTIMSSSSPVQTVELHDGSQHPVIGFGTYKVGFVPASASSSAPATKDRDPKDIIKV